MPKAKRNTNLSRVARRRVATSDNLPSAATRRTESAKSGIPDPVKVKVPTENKTKIHQTKNNNKNSMSDGVVDNNEPDIPQTQQLSRGQRKRQAKREQFLRKEKMILSSLMLQRQEDQKKRIDGLDAIKQALMNTTAKNKVAGEDDDGNTRAEPQHVSTNKAKRKLVASEVEHINLILQHPAFKEDPFETMQEHLRNTFAEDRKHQEKLSQKRTQEEKRKIETKRLEKDGIKKKTQKKKYKPRRTK